MKIAVLTHKPRPIDIDKIFNVVKVSFPEISLIDVSLEECKKVKAVVKRNNLYDADLVLLDIPFKRLYKQARLVNKLKKIIIYEEDACQNFLPHSKWHNKFHKFYKELNNASVVSTGSYVSERLNKLGHKCYFLPKGFNSETLYLTNTGQRTVELGFIGTLRSNVYSERKNALETLMKEFDLQCLRTNGIDEYREKLNDIKIFFSADIGMEEYMCKNFEAMACGCVLIAYRQGNGEEEALGLKDMKNCVLYNTVDEAIEKIIMLRSNNDLLKNIAEAGRKQALNTYEYTIIGKKLAGLIQQEL